MQFAWCNLKDAIRKMQCPRSNSQATNLKRKISKICFYNLHLIHFFYFLGLWDLRFTSAVCRAKYTKQIAHLKLEKQFDKVQFGLENYREKILKRKLFTSKCTRQNCKKQISWSKVYKAYIIFHKVNLTKHNRQSKLHNAYC